MFDVDFVRNLLGLPNPSVVENSGEPTGTCAQPSELSQASSPSSSTTGRFGRGRVKGDDNAEASDDWIAERIGAIDVCVTADILLAFRGLKKGARAVSPTRKHWTEANIGNALASHVIARHMRELWQNTHGPAPLTKSDRSRFLVALDTALQAALREAARS